jgi:transketolase
VIPADSLQTESAIRATLALPGPVYYSLGKDDRSSVTGLDGKFELGRLQLIRRGPDLAIVSMGSISVEAVAAADELAARGIAASLAVLSNFSPDPAEHLVEILSAFPHVISVEAQAASGGLAALIATVIASNGLSCRLWPLAVRHSPDGTSGSQQNRWRKHGLDRSAIVENSLRALGAKNQ